MSLECSNQNNSRLWSAIKWESVLLVVVVTVLVLMYAFLSESYVPTQVISQPATQAFIDFGNSSACIVPSSCRP